MKWYDMPSIGIDVSSDKRNHWFMIRTRTLYLHRHLAQMLIECGIQVDAGVWCWSQCVAFRTWHDTFCIVRLNMCVSLRSQRMQTRLQLQVGYLPIKLCKLFFRSLSNPTQLKSICSTSVISVSDYNEFYFDLPTDTALILRFRKTHTNSHQLNVYN